MRNRFDDQLKQLNIELIRMGALCEDAISFAVKTLLEDNEAYISRVHSIDEDIDHLERDIEGLCMKLLLQQQPVARDLRLISAAMKMVSDMERIGDQASDIVEITKYIKDKSVRSRIHIRDMSQAAIKMVTDSVSSFVNKDIDLAHSVIAYDDIVDELFVKVKEELIKLISENTSDGEFCLDLLMIAKYLERIGDHAVNIAEWVEFSLVGRIS